ncbi:MAG: hypothetical protein U0638_12500 [Phycisphaerales bacterium]
MEEEQRLARERIDLPLDLVDAAEHILEGSGMVDGGADQPELGERQADQEDGLARRRHGGDAAQEGGQRRRGDGHSTIQRTHAERHKAVQGLVLLHKDVDRAGGVLVALDGR